MKYTVNYTRYKQFFPVPWTPCCWILHNHYFCDFSKLWKVFLQSLWKRKLFRRFQIRNFKEKQTEILWLEMNGKGSIVLNWKYYIYKPVCSCYVKPTLQNDTEAHILLETWKDYPIPLGLKTIPNSICVVCYPSLTGGFRFYLLTCCDVFSCLQVIHGL